MAILCWVGETRYFAARSAFDGSVALFLHREAAALFPFEYRLREGNAAIAGMANGIPPDIALRDIDALLAVDPWSGSMTYLKFLQELRRGRRDDAALYLDRLRRLGPEWEVTQTATDIWNQSAPGRP